MISRLEAMVLILAQHQRLCANGWGTDDDDFDRSRAHMTSTAGLEEFARALEFVEARWRPTQNITRYQSSYGLKHTAERWHREVIGRNVNCYVSNGALIAAALCLGYRHRIIPGSPNCFFNVGRIKRLDA